MKKYSNIARRGASRCVMLFSDNVSHLNRVFGLRHGSSRFVTVCHGLSRSDTVCPDSNTPPIYGFCNYIFFDSSYSKTTFHQKHFFRQTWPPFPTNMVHSDTVEKFWEHWTCIQILNTLLFLAYFKTMILRDIYIYAGLIALARLPNSAANTRKKTCLNIQIRRQ